MGRLAGAPEHASTAERKINVVFFIKMIRPLPHILRRRGVPLHLAKGLSGEMGQS